MLLYKFQYAKPTYSQCSQGNANITTPPRIVVPIHSSTFHMFFLTSIGCSVRQLIMAISFRCQLYHNATFNNGPTAKQRVLKRSVVFVLFVRYKKSSFDNVSHKYYNRRWWERNYRFLAKAWILRAARLPTKHHVNIRHEFNAAGLGWTQSGIHSKKHVQRQGDSLCVLHRRHT
jgi:hypothetical protein